MELLEESRKRQEEWVAARAYLHKHAEVGFDLPQTLAFLRTELEAIGCQPKACGRAGLLVTIGENTGRVVLLRADIDGLPVAEKSGLACASKNGNMHACGHDMHATMLLGAAKLLKAREKELGGQVKLLFQPAEEILEGAKDVIENGALLDPVPQAAMMIHVMTAVELSTGMAVVASEGVSAPAADYFTVKIQGKGCHGSAPWNGVDATMVGAYVLLALQELAARELTIAEPAVLTVGSFHAGKAGNVIADEAELSGTLRAFDEGVRAQVKTRLEKIAKGVAKSFRAKATIRYGGGCPTLVNDGKVSVLALQTAKKLLGEGKVFASAQLGGDVKKTSGGSEDFAYISHEVPSVMIALAAGQKGKGYDYPLHHPKARFDEGALALGVALYAQFAVDFLRL